MFLEILDQIYVRNLIVQHRDPALFCSTSALNESKRPGPDVSHTCGGEFKYSKLSISMQEYDSQG